MIIVDSALKKRQEEGNPVRVAVVGAGFIGKAVVYQIENYVTGMRLVALSNRTLSKAEQAIRLAGVSEIDIVENVTQLEESVAKSRHAITDNAMLLCEADGIDVIIEATSDVEFTANLAVHAIENKKNIVLMNADCDATVGPILKVKADRAGAVISATDGDQPGSMMNLYRFVKSIGYKPVLIGNMKGLQDFYRTPDTQKEFAAMYGLSPKMATSFADGTKISMENTLVANATGFKTGKRGMFGPKCDHVDNAKDLFSLELLLDGGIVDYILGARPGPGVFVLGYDENQHRIPYMRYYKLGDGPLYVFYTPYHLPTLEVPFTAARGVLFRDAAVAPLGGPVCDVMTVAKRNLKAGEVLDGAGGFTCYGMIENAVTCKKENLLLMGLSEGCRLKRNVPKDQPITNEDVEFLKGRLIDKLRAEQDAYFSES
ncbi:MAG: NAD(P)H-dependent oxidoreductase [Candidatus Loosdrechtia sp.]|uniref:NAD(P)H-dependent oxidoreductase n=1 Tax=Candidatus Loosdrechtia sp. TaxID=3101272 RepID=UPI003A6D478F|nr:MAG: SAF domain-containing protein [Candidatus Jettenia sp. AMX2]